MFTPQQTAQLQAINFLNTAEVALLIAESAKGIKHAKEDDGKLSTFEVLGIVWEERQEANAAFADWKQIGAELKGIGPAKIEVLADIIFPAFSGSPKHTRRRVNGYIGLIRELANIYEIETSPETADVAE